MEDFGRCGLSSTANADIPPPFHFNLMNSYPGFTNPCDKERPSGYGVQVASSTSCVAKQYKSEGLEFSDASFPEDSHPDLCASRTASFDENHTILQHRHASCPSHQPFALEIEGRLYERSCKAQSGSTVILEPLTMSEGTATL
jgi:hypothetical protein